jgi:hypothetical protein
MVFSFSAASAAVLYVLRCVLFCPAGQKKNTRRVKTRGLRKSYYQMFLVWAFARQGKCPNEEQKEGKVPPCV